MYSTAVGYTGGSLENPTYQQVCSGRSGHNEVVLVAYDESKVSPPDFQITQQLSSRVRTRGLLSNVPSTTY